VKARRQAADEETQLLKLRSEQALQLESAQLHAQSEFARHQARLAEEAQQTELVRARAAKAEAQVLLSELETRAAEFEAHRQALAAKVELDRVERQRSIENLVSAEAISMAVAQKLPELAMAFHQQMGEVNITSFEGGNPYGFIAAAVEGVLGLAKSAGLKVSSATELLKNPPA
jgi:flotillin